MVAASKANGSDLAVIYMDLETSGFGSRAEILQLAAKWGGHIFNVYVTPVGRIQAKASEVNGLTRRGDRLLYRGEEVQSVPIKTALLQFIEWMRSLEVRCCLAAHNLPFDGPKLWTEIQRHSMIAEFEEMVDCFVDTLSLAKTLRQKEFENYGLQALTARFKIEHDAHTAVADCEALEQVLREMEITDENLLEYSQPFEQQINHWAHLEELGRLRSELSPLDGPVKPGIIKKLAEAKITIEILTDAYGDGGGDGLRDLFKRRNLRFHKKTIDSIINFFAPQII